MRSIDRPQVIPPRIDRSMFSFGFLVVVVFLFVLYKRVSRGYRFYNALPGPKMYPIVGNLFEVFGADQTHVYKLMRKFSSVYGTFRLWALGIGHIHTSRAREAEILMSSTQHSDKSSMYGLLTSFLGTGLLISNGQKWHVRRKMLTPAFHFNILQKFALIFNEESAKVVNQIGQQVDTGETVLDISKLCCRLTLNVICESAMGVKLDAMSNGAADEYRRNIYKVSKILVHRVMRPWLYPDWIFSILGYQRQVDKCVRITKGFTKRIIQARRKVFDDVQVEEREAG